MAEPRSTTKGSHTSPGGSKVHVTKISQGSKKASGYGNSSERSQEVASKKWENKK